MRHFVVNKAVCVELVSVELIVDIVVYKVVS